MSNLTTTNVTTSCTKRLNSTIQQCIRETERLVAENAYGQNDNRIANLTTTRMNAVRRLSEVKRGA